MRRPATSLPIAVLALSLVPTAAASYGDAIPPGSGELTISVTQAGLVNAIDGVRWTNGSIEVEDDLVALDMDRSGTFTTFDVVVADASQLLQPGKVLAPADLVRLAAATPLQLNAVYADGPNANDTGYYGAGDLVYLTTGGPGDLPGTNANGVSIRMTNTTYGPPGSFVRTGDADRSLVGASVTSDFGQGAGNASLAFREFDSSHRYEGQNNETLYLTPHNASTGSLRPFSIRLYGPLASADSTPTPSNSTTTDATQGSDTATSTSQATTTPDSNHLDPSPGPGGEPEGSDRFVPHVGAVMAVLAAALLARRRL